MPSNRLQCGLATIVPARWLEHYDAMARDVGVRPFIAEGRATFLALVPDRYKVAAQQQANQPDEAGA